MKEVIIKMSDFHSPFHDIKSIKTALSFARYINPQILILDEVIDFYSISRFNKDPNRKLSLQKDIDKTVSILTEIRKSLPKTRIIMVKSNHDRRLKKYLNSKAEELSQLKCLRLESLLKLNELRIEYKTNFVFRKVLFKHGSIVRKDSAYSAKAENVKEGVSGVSGHTHRLGMYFKTLRGGEYVWLEGGCLCKTKAGVEYIEGTANWQQGISMFTFKKDRKRFHPEIIPIIENEILWGGKVFRGDK